MLPPLFALVLVLSWTATAETECERPEHELVLYRQEKELYRMDSLSHFFLFPVLLESFLCRGERVGQVHAYSKTVLERA